MSTRKFRLQILEKIAQSSAPPSSSNTSMTPTPGIQPPPNYLATDAWGWLSSAYHSGQSVNDINYMVNILSIALHYSTNGQYNLQTLKSQISQVDPSSFPSIDAKNLFNLFALVYRTFLNRGIAPNAPFTGDQIHRWADEVSNSQQLFNLSQLNPTGPIAQKVPGNFKDNILNTMNDLRRNNPTVQSK